MVTIDEVDSEVVIDSPSPEQAGKAEAPVEVRLEELREVVRELIREQLDEFLRTEVHG